MIVDHKSRDLSISKTLPLLHPDDGMASSSTLERKLSVELPTPRQIYTVGSTVSGIIHLGTKDRELIQEVQVSLVCAVRSVFHRYYGGTSHDIRRETTNLVHRDQTLWSRGDGDASNPPADFAFQITVPEVGNDTRAKPENPNTPLPPSFHAGKHQGLKNMMTYGTKIGFVKYHIKASVMRKGTFKRSKERAFGPFIFLPTSPPPPLLPIPPEVISAQELDTLKDLWNSDHASIDLRHAVFRSNGQAALALWMPRVPSFPRLTRIPFFLCLTLQTRLVKDTSDPHHSSSILPPPPQINKASMYLQLNTRVCARGGVQHHSKVFDKAPTDNLLHGITPQEDKWTLKKEGAVAYWEMSYIWRGLWTFREAPNFENRQLTWKYALVAEVPIKGLGNDLKLVSRNLEVNTGVTAGSDVITSSEEDMLELPPDYFDLEESQGEDVEDEDRDEKGTVGKVQP